MSTKSFKQSIVANIEKQEKSLADRFDAVDIRMQSVPPLIRHSKVDQQSGAAPETRKSRVVKDSFSMPAEDYAVIEKIQLLAGENRLLRTKSEVVRAALRYFDSAEQSEQLAVLSKVVKVGYGPKR